MLKLTRKRTIAAISTLLILTCSLGWGRKKKYDFPPPPLPALMVRAKTAFLLNSQTTSKDLTKNGNALAFNALYADMKRWGRYQLVGSPDQADIVISLEYRPYSEGSSKYGYYNTYTKSYSSQSVERMGADFVLVVYAAKSREQLWSMGDACGSAYLIRNQRKEVVKSIGRLVADMKAAMESSEAGD